MMLKMVLAMSMCAALGCGGKSAPAKPENAGGTEGTATAAAHEPSEDYKKCLVTGEGTDGPAYSGEEWAKKPQAEKESECGPLDSQEMPVEMEQAAGGQ